MSTAHEIAAEHVAWARESDGCRESHAHRLAKELMAAWLRLAAKRVGMDGDAQFGSRLGWRVNRGSPHWGVWTEYPICRHLLTVWDESSPRWLDNPPTFDELRELDITPDAILDIAIQHKGQIAWGIEIAHKHPVSELKINFLRHWTGLTLIEIPSRWVLGQVSVPEEIPAEFFLSW